jgi:hypothetical protein
MPPPVDIRARFALWLGHDSRELRSISFVFYPCAWQCGGDGIGIDTVAGGIRVKSLCTAWRIDEGYQRSASAMPPESYGHIHVDEVDTGGPRGLNSLLDGVVEENRCEIYRIDDVRIRSAEGGGPNSNG